jgi:hypothetical protein
VRFLLGEHCQREMPAVQQFPVPGWSGPEATLPPTARCTSFLDLFLSIANHRLSTRIYEKRDYRKLEIV